MGSASAEVSAKVHDGLANKSFGSDDDVHSVEELVFLDSVAASDVAECGLALAENKFIMISQFSQAGGDVISQNSRLDFSPIEFDKVVENVPHVGIVIWNALCQLE